jgi:plasmid stabilization system protein ParE
MKVRYTPFARSDIARIYLYLDERSPAGARNVLKAIYAGIQFIAEQPLASASTDDTVVRVKIVRRYRYKIFYRIVGDAIEILHVRHTSRRPWTTGER